RLARRRPRRRAVGVPIRRNGKGRGNPAFFIRVQEKPGSLAVERLRAGGLAVSRQAYFLHLVLGRLEQPVAMRLERLAALVDTDRLVERHVAALQILDDAFQRRQRLLEAHRRDVLVGRVSGHFYPSIRRRTWAATEKASP